MNGHELNDNRRVIWASWALAALRVVTALVFLQHGLQKLLAFPIPPVPGYQHMSLAGVAGLMEVVGTPFLVAGLFTRSISFVMSGLMAFAYFMGHAGRGLFPIANGGDVAVLLCFIFLHMSFVGPGAFAVDTLLSRRRALGAPIARDIASGS